MDAITLNTCSAKCLDLPKNASKIDADAVVFA